MDEEMEKQLTQEITLSPHAKINLGLFIKGKRTDGYHLLETLLYPIDHVKDSIRLCKSTGSICHLFISGIALDGKNEDNLCVQAYKLLAQQVGTLPGVEIHLEKHIPAGAGLGGGSSDAAACLKGLNELFDLGFTTDELASFAGALGADVPFFLYDTPMIASGIGTVLVPFKFKDFPYQIKLITPPIHSSTLAAYKALDYTQCDPTRDLQSILRSDPANWRQSLVNDLERPIFQKYPELARIKQQLYDEGAIYAAMSGSGSAVFGLFPI